MDISIVSGTYNRLQYLQKMVSSVRRSVSGVCGLSYEIVLVDGGSNDGTIEWCQSQPNINLIQHGKLMGAVKAFNDGAYTATGKYIIMANDDIEFVEDSIWHAYFYMETNPQCGGGCFYQNRNGRDWHVEGMQAVHMVNGSPHRVHVYYAQVGIFPKWLGDKVGWWCDELEYGQYLRSNNYGDQIGLHTYGGDNELSAKIIDLGYTVEPITPKSPLAKIIDREAVDDLRRINNIDGAHDPRAVRGAHPDSHKFGQKWINRNNTIGIRGHYPGPVIKDKPMVHNPYPEKAKERILYLPLFEQGWQVQKEQKIGLRDALANVGLVMEFDYMSAAARDGNANMLVRLERLAHEFKPTVLLSQLHNSDQINAGDLMKLRGICGADCHFVNWNGDYWPDQLLDEKGINLARAFDLMTTVNRDVVEQHQARGINTQYWQIGWEPLGRNQEPEIHHDIVFLASGYSKKRQELGRVLAHQPFSVGLYGSGWPKGMSKGQNLYNFKEACKIYRGAKLAFGDSQWPESGFVSNRIFQILAAGNCVLCHQWFRGIELLGLDNNFNCLIWQNLDELNEMIPYWLSDSFSHKLPEIAANGENLALERHSFDSRVSELWQMLNIGVSESEIWRW